MGIYILGCKDIAIDYCGTRARRLFDHTMPIFERKRQKLRLLEVVVLCNACFLRKCGLLHRSENATGKIRGTAWKYADAVRNGIFGVDIRIHLPQK